MAIAIVKNDIKQKVQEKLAKKSQCSHCDFLIEKQDLINSANYRFRGSLAHIMGASELLLSEALLDDAQKEYVGIIMYNGRKILRVLEETLLEFR